MRSSTKKPLVGGFLANIRAELVSGRAPSEIIGWHDKLVARKRELFSGDVRFVGNWDLRQDVGAFTSRWRLECPLQFRPKLKSAGYKALG